EERAAAGPAEAPRAVVRGPVADGTVLARADTEALVRDPDPGDEARAVRAPAHRAVAVRGEERRRLDLEADGSTEARAGDGRGRHGATLAESRCHGESVPPRPPASTSCCSPRGGCKNTSDATVDRVPRAVRPDFIKLGV